MNKKTALATAVKIDALAFDLDPYGYEVGDRETAARDIVDMVNSGEVSPLLEFLGEVCLCDDPELKKRADELYTIIDPNAYAFEWVPVTEELPNMSEEYLFG